MSEQRTSDQRIVDWLRNYKDEHGMTWDVLHEAADRIEWARRILEPLAEHDPEVREWLGLPRWSNPASPNNP